MHGRAALAEVIHRRERGATARHEIKSLGDGLLELRVQVGRDPFRAVFFEDSPVHDVCVIAVYKNTNKLPQAELKRAHARRRRWLEEGERAQSTR